MKQQRISMPRQGLGCLNVIRFREYITNKKKFNRSDDQKYSSAWMRNNAINSKKLKEIRTDWNEFLWVWTTGTVSF